MANIRQYIGARYVIKIYENSTDPSSAEWEQGNFEPLVMVTWQNGSYLSKKEVPATVGNPASNPSYWVQTGFYNGQIAALQQQIDAINNNELPAITTEIQTLSNKIDNVQRKAIYIGNSYAQGVGSTSGTDGIYALTKNMFADSKLYADGGVGFLTYTGHTVTFESLLDDAIADNYFDSLDEVTDIVILSAWGDTLAIKNRGVSNGIADMRTAMQSFMTKVKNNFSNIKRVTLSFVETRSIRTISNTAEGTSLYNEPFDAYWIMKTLAPRAGIEYLGWTSWETFMAGSSFTASDNYHPSDAGYTVISTNFISAYNGNYASAPRYMKINMAFNITSGSIIETYSKITPDDSVIELGRLNIAAGATPTQYAQIDLIDFSTAANTSLVPPMPLAKIMNINNIDILPDADFTHVLTVLATMKPNSEGSIKIDSTTFNATETLSARANAHCLENVYQIVNAL